MKKILFGFVILSIVACKKENSTTISATKQDVKSCKSSDFEKKILELDEIKTQAKYLDSLTQGKGRIAFMVDSTKADNNWDYSISVGYNGPERFETYHIFEASSNLCDSLKIIDAVSGETIPVKKWQAEKTLDK
ncbi:hypothetical protein [Soonwooa sp.]|uniref:hypothetical protein n=1 Tax=Soonwooa sp. TaxID=1938592 RepID=UPI002632F9CE|nr:hypothetical protein [Soonwooa sp.]